MKFNVNALVSKNNLSIIKQLILFIVMVFLSFIVLLPFFWMLSSSLKLDNEVFSVPIQWIPNKLIWRNYIEIWKQIPFLTFFKNTIKLSVIITFLQVLTSSFAAYGFSKMRFKGRDTLFLAYIATIAVPWQVYMVPQFILMKKFGLADTHLSLILLQTFTAFGVFLLRQFYLSIPEELSEAARIDGMSEYGIYFKIVLPLSKPALATLTLFTFVNTWNDFLGPLIYLNSTNLKTIQLGLQMFISQYTAQYALIMAASVVSIVPLLIAFIFTQNYFVEGIATTGLK
ncbi:MULTISPECIES: carbohydrate ABC transporter permease [Thermoanaerobacterium]|uniref:Sugar ABC transporter ATP-binding protein n=2 Tax=Thermoanaerobacterium TaxID=28895 RepID=A0A231VF29_THETR|nr:MULTISPECIES: carbohydrate ABC transporter permease [Thermoanaerobacterium]MBP2071522.1 multiple sugar transport system permease protein [Thermoanaerobacterium butyriciformans]OXT06729.1 sugar ABC transporter ATP-binding protein [Thermoanaerobacterium thermosaccharolyticum]